MAIQETKQSQERMGLSIYIFGRHIISKVKFPKKINIRCRVEKESRSKNETDQAMRRMSIRQPEAIIIVWFFLQFTSKLSSRCLPSHYSASPSVFIFLWGPLLSEERKGIAEEEGV